MGFISVFRSHDYLKLEYQMTSPHIHGIAFGEGLSLRGSKVNSVLVPLTCSWEESSLIA
jgi:hypothetical protein